MQDFDLDVYYQTILRNGRCTSAFRGDIHTHVLAAEAQELHERYLAGNAADDEDPEVEDAPEVEDRAAGVDLLSRGEGSSNILARSTPTGRSSCTRAASTDTNRNVCDAVPGNPERRADRTKVFSKQKKRDRRVFEGPGPRYSPYVGRSTKASAKKKKHQAQSIHTDFVWTSSVADRQNRVAKSAMVGVRLQPDDYPREPETKAQTLQRGLDEIEWDGK